MKEELNTKQYIENLTSRAPRKRMTRKKRVTKGQDPEAKKGKRSEQPMFTKTTWRPSIERQIGVRCLRSR